MLAFLFVVAGSAMAQYPPPGPTPCPTYYNLVPNAQLVDGSSVPGGIAGHTYLQVSTYMSGCASNCVGTMCGATHKPYSSLQFTNSRTGATYGSSLSVGGTQMGAFQDMNQTVQTFYTQEFQAGDVF